MKRIGIFAFYDEDGVVDDFIVYLLNSLNDVLDKLIFVTNGSLNDDGLSKVKEITDNIYFREDIGYDFGAWNEVLYGDFSKHENWEQWDEIVLINDTFYGPFIPWCDVFDVMDKKEVDFWALEESKIKDANGKFLRHIVPYFLVISKKMFQNKMFEIFWKSIRIDGSYSENDFEFRFASFFEEHGFRYTTWISENGGKKYIDTYLPYTRNYRYCTMLRHCLFVRCCNMPVVKVKMLSIFLYPESQDTIYYIKKSTSYDVELIYSHLNRLFSANKAFSYSEEVLASFVSRHKNIYFLGHGGFAYGLKRYFDDMHWSVKGYIVSNPTSTNECSLKNFKIKKDDGIIVALGIMNVNQLKDELQNIPKSQLLLYSHRSLDA